MSNDKTRIIYLANFLENDLDKVLDIALIVVKFAPLPAPLIVCLELLTKHRKKIAMAAGLVNKCAEKKESSLIMIIAIMKTYGTVTLVDNKES